MSFITIFTPTYNRGYILENLYKSLLKQNSEIEFEWIIIDDGSTDNTEEIVKLWKEKNNKFEIIYKKQENQGKHVAINNGLDIAKGKLFFIVDSDDWLTDNALEIIKKWEKTLDNGKGKFAGIAGLRGKNNNTLIGTTFKSEYIDATSLGRYKYNIRGDKAEIFYTSILKEYKFPTFQNEKFMNEAYIWNKLAIDGYQLRWFNEILVICNYREDGLTKNREKLEINSPNGFLIYLKQLIDVDKNPIKRIAHLSSYVRIAKNIYSNQNIKKQLDISYFRLYKYIVIYKIRSLWRKR